MASEKVTVETSAGVARLWLDRPDVHNAFDADVIAGLSAAIDDLTAREDVRVIVLGGRGRSFSAGADLKWMKSAAALSAEENVAGARRLAGMLRKLDQAPQATIARVQGAALGGGLGLLATCDLVLAAERAKFGFSEVRLGMVPAVISPFCVAKIGVSHARRLFVTGERFDAAEAARIGLVHRVVPDEEALDAAVDAAVAAVLASGPVAVGRAKALIREVTRPIGEAAIDAYTTATIAELRVSPEGQEGIGAFFAKRLPAWAPAQADA